MLPNAKINPAASRQRLRRTGGAAIGCVTTATPGFVRMASIFLATSAPDAGRRSGDFAIIVSMSG
jgi:hypothetical protein